MTKRTANCAIWIACPELDSGISGVRAYPIQRHLAGQANRLAAWFFVIDDRHSYIPLIDFTNYFFDKFFCLFKVLRIWAAFIYRYDVKEWKVTAASKLANHLETF